MRTHTVSILFFLTLLASCSSAAAMSSPAYNISGGDISSSGGDANVSSPGYINKGSVSGQTVAAGPSGTSASYSNRLVSQSELITMAANSRIANGVLDPENTTGIPTIADGVIAIGIVFGDITPTPEQLKHGDVAPLLNGQPSPNGVIDLGDVLLILRRVVGLVTW